MINILISKDLISYIIKWLEKEIREWKIDAEKDDSKCGENWDANDMVIFENFMLPGFRDSIGKDIKYDELLEKGMTFILDNIPSIIMTVVPSTDNEIIGGFIKLGYQYNSLKIIEMNENTSDAEVQAHQMAYEYRINRLKELCKSNRTA